MDCCPGCCFPDVIFFQYFSFNFGEITKATFSTDLKPKMDVLLGKNANSIGLLFLLKKKVCNKCQYICIMQVQSFDSQYFMHS